MCRDTLVVSSIRCMTQAFVFCMWELIQLVRYLRCLLSVGGCSPSGNDLLLVYQKDYGEDEVLPDGKTVVSINFTGDNHGPHSYERVKKIYADLRKRYPQAQLVGASFNDVARELLLIKKDLPVVTSEIGDTWIFGYGGAPIRMAKFRAVSRLYSQWLNEGKIKKDSDVALDFAAELGLIAEHTQGVGCENTSSSMGQI